MTKVEPPAQDSHLETLEYESRPRTWKVSTLTYTSGGLVALFLWLLGGDFVWQLRERAISPTIPFLLRKLGASDTLAGILFGTLPAALNIVLTPSVSYWSDRYRSRLGRRIPFLLVTTPFAVGGMLGLAFTPMLGHQLHEFLGPRAPSPTICVLSVFALFWMIFEVAALVCLAIHGALINDVVPRSMMGRFFGLFRVISLSAGIIFNYFFLGKVEDHFMLTFITLGLAYGVVYTLMCLNVKEGEYPPPAPPAKNSFGRLGANVETYFRDCFTKPYYLWFFFSFFLAYVAFTPINIFSLYYAQSVHMGLAEYGKFSAIQLFCSMIQAPVLGWMCDKFHPLRMTIFALCMYAMTTFAAFFFVHDFTTFAIAHVLCGTCSGIWITATSPLSQVLMPRLKFATFASAQELFSSVGRMVTPPIIGLIMDSINVGRSPGNRDYHHIYLWASCFITLSMLVTLVVYRYFQAYGGTKHYIPPE